ncbi:hypothetical protein FACS1894202_05270 [Clostridia bacterium]|nr:hypothetical protein FACS1894202_05270 [Clostridia bacterium]
MPDRTSSVVKDSEELLTELHDIVEKAKAFPFGRDLCLLDRDDILSRLDEIRAMIPEDIEEARGIVKERNKVLAEAREDAGLVKQKAEEYARKMTNQEEILNSARVKAAELIKNAETKAAEIAKAAEQKKTETLKAATDYLDDALKKAEETIAASLATVKTTRGQFGAAMNSIGKHKPTK